MRWSSFIFLLQYVDDRFIVASHLHDVYELKIMLGMDFDTKDLGVAKKILGMKLQKDMSAIKLWLSQKTYAKKVVSTPLENHFKIL